MNQKQIDAIASKAAVAYKVKQSFIGRNFYLFYGICAVYFLAALWSMATAGGNLYIRVAGMFGETTLALVLAGVGAFALVGLQFFTGKGAVDDLQIRILSRDKDGEYKHSLGERAFFFLKVFGFVAATFVSFTMSIDGAEAGNEYLRTERRAPKLEMEDTRYFDEQLSRIAANIETERGRKWQGVLVTDAARRIERYEKQAEAVRSERAKYLARIGEKNDLAWQAWNEKTEENTIRLQGYTGVGEIICIICVLFIGLYDDGLYREANSRRGGPMGATAGAPVGFRNAPAFAEKAQQQEPKMCANVAQQSGAVLRFSEPQMLRNSGTENARESIGFRRNFVAPVQQKAQHGKRNKSATANPQYKSAQSAIRNAKSAIRKAQHAMENGEMEQEVYTAFVALKQEAIRRNEKRAEKLRGA